MQMTDKPDYSDFLDDPELEELLVKARAAFDNLALLSQRQRRDGASRAIEAERQKWYKLCFPQGRQ
jgi:hypothetical protein